MTRPIYRWYVATEPGDTLAEGERYAHNSALDAGTAAVREIARRECQLYTRVGVERLPTCTELRWSGESDGRVLLVVVRSPS